jgi:phosphohistidine phosphatase
MSHIYLLRHAKTEQNLFKRDFDRELIEKWFSQIEKLIKKLKEDNITFDMIVSSPARRTKQTAEEVHKKVGRKKIEIIFDDDLYVCSANYLFSKICELEKEKLLNILIVWHNYAIEDVANHFANWKVGHVKTCGMFKIN